MWRRGGKLELDQSSLRLVLCGKHPLAIGRRSSSLQRYLHADVWLFCLLKMHPPSIKSMFHADGRDKILTSIKMNHRGLGRGLSSSFFLISSINVNYFQGLTSTALYRLRYGTMADFSYLHDNRMKKDSSFFAISSWCNGALSNVRVNHQSKQASFFEDTIKRCSIKTKTVSSWAFLRPNLFSPSSPNPL